MENIIERAREAVKSFGIQPWELDIAFSLEYAADMFELDLEGDEKDELIRVLLSRASDANLKSEYNNPDAVCLAVVAAYFAGLLEHFGTYDVLDFAQRYCDNGYEEAFDVKKDKLIEEVKKYYERHKQGEE